jgi:hypothetical protein
VNSLGYSHPVLNNALIEQAQKLWHVSNVYNIPEQEVLAKKLCELSFADYVFLTAFSKHVKGRLEGPQLPAVPPSSRNTKLRDP